MHKLFELLKATIAKSFSNLKLSSMFSSLVTRFGMADWKCYYIFIIESFIYHGISQNNEG